MWDNLIGYSAHAAPSFLRKQSGRAPLQKLLNLSSLLEPGDAS
jgi:hypothetical protein